MKKLFKYLFALTLVLTLVGCSNEQVNEETTSETKSEVKTTTLKITIIDQSIEDEEVILFDGEVSVDIEVTTLEEFLITQTAFSVQHEKGQYGMTILGMNDVSGDWDKGPWWLYESENNSSCQEAGYCLGASELEIANGDHFIFTLTSNF